MVQVLKYGRPRSQPCTRLSNVVHSTIWRSLAVWCFGMECHAVCLLRCAQLSERLKRHLALALASDPQVKLGSNFTVLGPRQLEWETGVVAYDPRRIGLRIGDGAGPGGPDVSQTDIYLDHPVAVLRAKRQSPSRLAHGLVRVCTGGHSIAAWA